jgi:hypothetical protein
MKVPMKHTIKTASGAITIEAAGKPGIEFVLVTLKPPFLPSFDIQLTPEQSGLLAQAFDLATEEISAPPIKPRGIDWKWPEQNEPGWPIESNAGQGLRA